MNAKLLSDIKSTGFVKVTDVQCKNGCGNTVYRVNGKIIQPCPKCRTAEIDAEIKADLHNKQAHSYQGLLDKHKMSVTPANLPANRKSQTVHHFVQEFRPGDNIIICGGDVERRSLYKNAVLNGVCGDHKYKVDGSTGFKLYQRYIDAMNEREPISRIQKHIMAGDIYVISRFGKHGFPQTFTDMLKNVVDEYTGSLFIISHLTSAEIISKLDINPAGWLIVEWENKSRGWR